MGQKLHIFTYECEEPVTNSFPLSCKVTMAIQELQFWQNSSVGASTIALLV